MNGVAELKIKGIAYPLKFGMQAMMLYQTRTATVETATVELEDEALTPNEEAVEASSSIESIIKGSLEIIYAGMFGYAIRMEKKVPSFGEVCDLFDDLCVEKDFHDQMQHVYTVFNTSVNPIIAKPESAEPGKKKAQKK